MNTPITRQSIVHRPLAATDTPDKAENQSVQWCGYGLTPKGLARGWLIMAPLWEKDCPRFKKITTAENNVLYLTGNKESPDDKHYIEPVKELPDYILNDTILNGYGGCNAGDRVSDIVNEYKERSGYEVFMGKVDLPRVYEFDLSASHYFAFAPAFPRLEVELTKGNTEHLVMRFLNDDLYWKTNTWNAFTYEEYSLISLILPNYEVSSKKQFSLTLTELMSLPPDPGKFFPGGALYREAQDSFLSYQTENTSGFALSGDTLY